jgi:hypothetical protein
VVPPLAAKDCEYAVPAVPLGSDVVVIDKGEPTGLMVSVRLPVVAVCAGVLESVTLKVRAVELGPRGVPLIRPVEAFRVNGLGSVPEVIVHVYGVVPPLAAKDCEYAVPAVPLGSDVVVIAKGEDPWLTSKKLMVEFSPAVPAAVAGPTRISNVVLVKVCVIEAFEDGQFAAVRTAPLASMNVPEEVPTLV